MDRCKKGGRSCLRVIERVFLYRTHQGRAIFLLVYLKYQLERGKMSESEYQVDNDLSDDDYAVEEKPKQRLRQNNRNTNYQNMHREPKPQVEKKETRTKRSRYQTQSQNLQLAGPKRAFNYAEEYADEGEQEAPMDEQDEFSIFNIQIAQIIWRRLRETTAEEEYLIKFKGRSYLHCEWMTETEIDALGKPMKNKVNRFNKAFNSRIAQGNYDQDAIDEGKYFEQTYLEVDRILTATEMFPVIHQKKANEIKGKWNQSLMIVCSKLLNFTKNFVNYGVLFCEPVDTQRDGCSEYLKIITQPMDLGTIMNRIYLDIYKNANQFWRDVGLVFKNCLKFNKEPTSDLHILGLTLRECAIFLYDQWFHLSEERYQKLKEQLEPTWNQIKQEAMVNEGGEVCKEVQNLQLNQDPKSIHQNGGQKMECQKIDLENPMKQQAEEAIKQIPKPMDEENHPKQIAVQSQKPKEQEDDGEIKSEANSECKKGQNGLIQQSQEKKPQLQGQIDNSEDSSTSKQKEQILEEEDRQFLDMDNFYKKNIFLTEKKAQDPNNPEQLQLINPGEFSYKWLSEDEEEAAKFIAYNYEEIDYQDMKKLDLNVEADRLYLVKWKNLSYTEATWQLQSTIANVDKVNEFKMINKALGKQARNGMDSQREKHRILVDLQLNPKKRSRYSNFQLSDVKNKLYFYDVGIKKQPPQYKLQNQPVYKNYKLLRPYQLQSVNWLIKSWYEKRNTILADQMGLGKTIQSIALLYHLYSVENVKGPFLVIAPLSTLEHWKRTVEQWTNMNCVLYYDQNGQPGRRSAQYYEWSHTNITMKGNSVPSELNKFQILITSYQVFLMDFNEVIMNVPFQFIIVDEAHRLKNKNAKILTTLKRLPCKRVMLLTGTPIQNNTGELWSLLNYIHPEKFTSFDDFKRSFGDLSSHEQVENLNRVLKPYMLRRMKEDVEQSIPPLQETIIDVEMTNMQKTIYRALFEKNKNMLSKGLSSTSSYNTNLNNLEIQLRKCCNHPFLIKEIEQDILKEVYSLQEKADRMITASGKMVLVQKLLEKCKRQGKKVLIFSQFTHMLQLIEEYLRFKEYKFERIDGQVKAKERQASIDRYNNPNKKRDVFLLSTKAGGVGINLTSANVVIIYDSDWNPQNDVQATARAHRIGQKSQVQVYRLVTCNTYETEMFQRATQKLGIDKAIFMSGTFKETGDFQNMNETKASKGQMEMLLKKGILGFLQNEQNQQAEKADKFFNKNVDEILQNNSRVAKYSMINGSCTFSKQRFVSEGSDNQLKLNDPNFWNIVLKNVQSQTQQLLKKMKSAQNFKTVDDQRSLMAQASELMGGIIENKLSLTGFNADDEINLSEFLTLVNSQRQFHKHYRDLASQWLEQISKPSRRFKRFTLEDLEIPKKSQLTIAQQKKVNTRANQDENNIFGEEQEEQQEQQSDQNKMKITDAKKEDYLKKLCCLCEKAKCTVFCKGYCRRAYHQQCKKRFDEEPLLNYDETNIKNEPVELSMDNQQLKDMADLNFLCGDCKSNLVQCLICKGKGNYYGAEYKKNKKSKNKSGEQIVEEVNVNKNKRKNDLTKCSTANCAKFFHPKCIEEYDTKKLFKYIDANSMHFRCSLHYCNVCGISGDTMSIYQCVRCPKALHTRCMDKDKVVKISKKQFICDGHFKNKKDLKKIQDRFQTQTIKKFINKQDKVEIKKKQRVSTNKSEQIKEMSEEEQENENQVVHNYSTRRKGNANGQESGKQISQEPLIGVDKSASKQEKRGKKKNVGPLVTYQQLGLTPIKDFDYKNYDQDWCRYCGSRYSSNFTQGPWGSKTLCTVHYIKWKSEKVLKLDGYPTRPTQPIDPTNTEELRYISSEIHKSPELTYAEVLEYLESKKNPKRERPVV